MENAILTVKEAAVRLRCGLSTIYELFAAGSLQGFRLRQGRGGIRIYANSVDQLMRRNANAAPEPVPERKSNPRPAAVTLKGLVLRPPD